MNIPASKDHVPLAERMRPRSLSQFYGQEHIIGEGRLLSRMISDGRLVSLIFWGPPGSGKTTLGNLLSRNFQYPCMFFSAVLAGIKEVKQVMAQAESHRKLYGQPTILFIDEIHRFNKAQQGAFLPYVEKGDIILFGSTTENPSFEVIAPLLSRAKVLALNPLATDVLERILLEALNDETRGLGKRKLAIDEDALRILIDYSGGDARRALNTMEISASLVEGESILVDHVKEALQKRTLVYDKKGEEHFNLISALHKSLRNSDPDGALYWMARMLVAGEDPLYILRRLVRFATEDIGLADPEALAVTIHAKQAFEFIGLPEGELALAEAAIYLAAAPKSNRVYTALKQARQDAEARPYDPVPLHLRNPVTKLMKETGYGKDYQYAHDNPYSITAMTTLPEHLREKTYYRPGELGREREIRKRMEWWRERKKLASQTRGKKDPDATE